MPSPEALISFQLEFLSHYPVSKSRGESSGLALREPSEAIHPLHLEAGYAEAATRDGKEIDS